MNKLLYKDNKNRKKIYGVENKNFIKKNISKNFKFKNSIRINSNFSLFNSNNINSKVILNKRCILTGRNSKIAKNFNFSRISFLRISRLGYISGIRKSCW